MTYTIIICSYKYGHLASHAIETVLAQTKKFDKIFFVDDGVGDCTHLPNLYPEVEYVLRDKNLGTVDNFQDMLNRVTTDYVMFLGADNWLRPDTLEWLDKMINSQQSDIIMYDIMVTGEYKDEINKRHPGETLRKDGDLHWLRHRGHHGSMMYKTELAKSVGGYNAGYGERTLEDKSLYERMINTGAKLDYIPIPLLYYRRHRENFNPVK